jgi:hypothetical protein
MSGPLIADDDQTMIGSLFLVERQVGPNSKPSTAP